MRFKHTFPPSLEDEVYIGTEMVRSLSQFQQWNTFHEEGEGGPPLEFSDKERGKHFASVFHVPSGSQINNARYVEPLVEEQLPHLRAWNNRWLQIGHGY